MSIIDKLASSLDRRDEIPNQELAALIAKKQDSRAVAELIEHLDHKSKAIRHDCIKVLYEIGERKPSLISAYLNDFLSLLKSKDNRMQWGAMAAIDQITLENPKGIYTVLSQILAAADSGSVITRDHTVNVLIKLCSQKPYADKAFVLLLEQLLSCPTNQLPMYAERAVAIISSKYAPGFIEALTSRLPEIEKESKRKRVEKVLKKL